MVLGLILHFVGLAKKFLVITFVNPSLENERQNHTFFCCGGRGAGQEQALSHPHTMPSCLVFLVCDGTTKQSQIQESVLSILPLQAAYSLASCFSPTFPTSLPITNMNPTGRDRAFRRHVKVWVRTGLFHAETRVPSWRWQARACCWYTGNSSSTSRRDW